MRKYQIWKFENYLAISDEGSQTINFATSKNFKISWEKKTILKTETATKPAFLNFLRPITTGHGVFPIYNSKGEACEQIVNVPSTILTSTEILEYLNKYTILPQETPPWEEIIYKLKCFSECLTNEYYERIGYELPEGDHSRSEEEIDVHYFVTSPKTNEKKRGFVFTLPKPNRAHRKWVILPEYYDYQKNAWVDPESEQTEKREGERIGLIDKEKQIDQYDIDRAKKAFLKKGWKVKSLDNKPIEFDWKKVEIHPLAHLIPVMCESDRARLKEDIRLHGVNEALWLYEGKVLEGRTRFGICMELGIKPDFKAFKGPGSPKDFVISMNIHRRHLSSSQMAAIGVELYLPKYEKEAEKRMKNGGSEKIHEASRGKASQKVADELRTNEKYIYDAKKIKETDPDLFKEILSGDISISKAKQKIKLSSPKKRRTKKKVEFEKELKLCFQKVVDYSGNAKIVALQGLSHIYLNWNKRNGAKLLKELYRFKSDFPVVFQPTLSVVKNDDSELMEG